MAFQLKKIEFGRKRFVRKSFEQSVEDWPLELSRLLELVANQTQLQRIGNRVFIEFFSLEHTPSLLIEVIGPPTIVDHKSLEIVELELGFSYVLDLEIDHFQQSLKQIYKQIESVQAAFLMKYKNESEEGFLVYFQVVIEEEKIELHFFKQNDYSQKQL